MQIRINKPGLLSTVQDLGRFKYLANGVPVSGAMDKLSAAIANIACGNDMNDAVIEFTYADATFTAENDLIVAYCGGGLNFKVEGRVLPTGKPIFIPKGTAITSIPETEGCRTYLAIAGGWDVPVVMGSKSTCLVAGFGGYHGRVIKKGDALKAIGYKSELSEAILIALKGRDIKCANWSIARDMFAPADTKLIRVVPGPEFTRFDATSILNFLSLPYTLTPESNRMGYRLAGEKLVSTNKAEMISTAVTPGTIQVANDGSPILLMGDCQTTGGYPRIAQVTAVDLPLCAQLKPGDNIYFKEISRHEAEMLYLERHEELKQLQLAIKTKYLPG
ncbi:5-oxoprolinase subunit C family protein [Mucilaginibacter ginkgonis]|uniref:Biotin-dependent carboxyltransferase family protein n=1 Tax=Mucilaginibacter ginkgonis TaxID=2682091 RepID=A0A6I4I1N5_9SPHI|nr:biotin-dependent carboxyltransferase family protein [Mucilaginibacter ginkgonis]QQL51401.1 biotin-dependent carboxyltransferase family protein [Mucilaginibacter ginkgonis]